MSNGYIYRAAFGAWLNDTRNSAAPDVPWPNPAFDDETEDGVIQSLDLQQKAGFNSFNVFGLFATRSWSPDIPATVSAERAERVRRIIKEAHKRGIKLLVGLGVYSWGFDEIIAGDPSIQGTNLHAMCLSSGNSWVWQKKIIDYIMDNYDVDGFHLEASDQGRCSCEKCKKLREFAYYARINILCADYIRSRRPDMTLMVNMCGHRPMCAEEDYQELLRLGEHVDYIVDPSHYIVPGEYRERAFKDLKCEFGSSGGFWCYMPQAWDKLRWFFPYARMTGEYLKEFYGKGGRSVEFYMGATVNPSCEFTTLCGGKILCDPSREVADVAYEAVGELYGPDTPETQKELADLFFTAEDAYFKNSFLMPYNLYELHFTRPIGGPAGSGPDYLEQNIFMYFPFPPNRYITLNAQGRAKYRAALLGLSEQLPSLKARVKAKDKIDRIGVCIENVIKDIDSFIKA